ncbi:MAG TPA: hypothetical protein PK287_10720 [Tenuifilaceae bacterium]|jgi:hypothetical protein|nr:hypothetical protein [Bacteroidales bacterium]OQC62824.1 MAG: hypothetical protein BWX49_01525 [Bacteroidetes bacterium ADurb.Bin008]HOF92303.1 hypothetical protein [Tenuifilaceae bacterium]HQF02321.1 hypothetical protein [Bacteroidales bacterium]HRS47445.1 hypothetical protein [Tenuifilaceae bacterium]
MKKILKLFFIGSVSGTTHKHLTYRNIPVTNILGIKGEKPGLCPYILLFNGFRCENMSERYFKQNGDGFPLVYGVTLINYLKNMCYD